MKKFLSFISIMFVLFLFACNGKEVKPTVDETTSYFNPKQHTEVAIFPTYKLLGNKRIDIDSSIAYRDYYVWEDSRSGKYILITILTPKNGVFEKDIDWIDRESAIYSQGNTVAYNNVHERPAGIIYELGGKLPECLIIAQDFYFHEKEVMFKALIVPDEMCAENTDSVFMELNRVANMQP